MGIFNSLVNLTTSVVRTAALPVVAVAEATSELVGDGDLSGSTGRTFDAAMDDFENSIDELSRR